MVATWQTVPMVREVLRAMSKINARYIDQGVTRLFSSSRKPSIKFGGNMGASSINCRLHEFAKRCSIKWDGEYYRPSTHQFRKKFARLLFRQGLGIKELQEQLKHYDINMTRLYGEPNLYAELQKERFDASKDIYEELLTNQIPVIGGGAAEFENIRREFLGITRSDREKFLDQIPKNALIDQVDDGLCIYNARRALCGGDKVNCKPAHCLNSVIPLDTAKRSLQSRQRENERLLVAFKDQPFKKLHIHAQLETIEALLRQAESKAVTSTLNLKNAVLMEKKDE
jgi:hypothetical protein